MVETFNRSMLTKGDDPVNRIFQERDNLAKEYGITGKGYQDISGSALVGASKELGKEKESNDKMMTRMQIEGNHSDAKFGAEAWKEELKKFDDYSKDLAKRLGENYKTTLEVNKIQDSSTREGLTKQAGRSQRFASLTDQGPMAGLDIQLGLAQKIYDLDMKTVDADKLVLDYNKQRVDLAKAEADLRKASTDALIDAEGKILEIRKQQEDQIKGTFTSVILGAQNGGGKGALSAVKSTFEGYEKTILGNLLGSNFLNVNGMIPHADANSGIGKLLKGTPWPPPLRRSAVFEPPSSTSGHFSGLRELSQVRSRTDWCTCG
jgi:hypothetical protein